jgi:hypothetical protein
MPIAVIFQTSKILLKTIRMESTVERELPVNQADYRKAKGTRDHIANMRWLMEGHWEYGQQVHVLHRLQGNHPYRRRSFRRSHRPIVGK